MNTPIIANLLPRLREHAASHLRAYLEKGGELSPILESIEFWWDGIRDRDFPELPMWSDLPAPDRDALFDAWIEAVEEFFALRRRPGGDPVASSLPVSVAPAASLAAPGRVPIELTHPTIHWDYYEWLDTVKIREFDKKFISNNSESFQKFNAIAMWAWSQSRETLAAKWKASPPSPEKPVVQTTGSDSLRLAIKKLEPYPEMLQYDRDNDKGLSDSESVSLENAITELLKLNA